MSHPSLDTCLKTSGLLEVGIGVVDQPGKGSSRKEAARKLVRMALKGSKCRRLPARCLLLLATADWCAEANASIARDVRAECQNELGYEVPLIGGSMASLYLLHRTNQFIEHGVILVVFCSHDMWVTVGALEAPYSLSAQERQPKFKELVDHLERSPRIHLGSGAARHLLAFSPGIYLDDKKRQTYRDNELHEEILASFQYRYRLVGAAAANDLDPTAGYQFADDRCLTSGLALALVETDLASGTMMGHGFAAVPNRYVTITGLKDNAESGYDVATLDGQPAYQRLEELKRSLGTKMPRLLLGLPNGHDHFVVCPLSEVPNDGFLRLSRMAQRNDRLALLETDGNRLAETAHRSTTLAVAASGARKETLRLMCDLTCTGRAELYQSLTKSWKRVARRLKARFPKVPIVGGLCAGEFGIDQWRRAQANNFSFWVNCIAASPAPKAKVRTMQVGLLEAGMSLARCQTPEAVMSEALKGAVRAGAFAGATGGQICIVDHTVGFIFGKHLGRSLSTPGSGHNWEAVAARTLRRISRLKGNRFPRNLTNWALPVDHKLKVTLVKKIDQVEDILPLIIRSGYAVYVADCTDAIFHCDRRAAKAGGIVTFLAIPIIGSKRQAIATLQLSFRNHSPIDLESFGLWLGYAQKVAAALERAQELEERKCARQISELGNDILKIPLRHSRNLYGWCKSYLRGVAKILGATGAHLRLLERESGIENYRLVAAVGPLAKLRMQTRAITPGGGSCNLEKLKKGGWITHTKAATQKHNQGVKPLRNAEHYGNEFLGRLSAIESTAMLPLTYKHKVLGSFVIDSNKPYFFTERRARLAKMAAALAGAVLEGRANAIALGKLVGTEEYLKRRGDKALKLFQRERVVRETFEEVAHQVKGPLAAASGDVREFTERYKGQAAYTDFRSLEALLHRAQLNSQLIGLFAKLAQGSELDCKSDKMTPQKLMDLVNTICNDNRERISIKRHIVIKIDAESFSRSAPTEFSVNRELILQALHNLIDNAVKYSYSNTTILISGGRNRLGHFYIAVVNRGIPITEKEKKLVTERSWRGERAKYCVGEGSGLGLWIADRIMEAHQGKLEVFPTRPSDGITEVRLTFPS